MNDDILGLIVLSDIGSMIIQASTDVLKLSEVLPTISEVALKDVVELSSLISRPSCQERKVFGAVATLQRNQLFKGYTCLINTNFRSKYIIKRKQLL